MGIDGPEVRPVSEIARWLETHGLEKYADTFAENDIGLDVLPELDREDLRDLGVSLGDGKRLLKAARALLEHTAPEPSEPGISAEGAPNPPHAYTDAERRQLTVMFCDLVGSTELAQRFDPEELRNITRTYQDAAQASVEKFGGYVARYMGDGILAYFGYPQAHEDDVERSVRAGLDLVEVVPSLSTAPPLAVRVGIATGPVVVGDLIGEGASQESAAVGETPNLAARLQAQAAPNSVLISSASRRLVRGSFHCTDLGVHELRGFSEPERIWRVNAEQRAESRFDTRRREGTLPLVGRASELALLLDRWETAREGEGQVVCLLGEPGIGKSRLVLALRDSLQTQSMAQLRYQCWPDRTSSAFFPIIDGIERGAGFSPNDSDDEKLAKTIALLTKEANTVEQVAPLYAALLSLRVERRASLSNPSERARLISALVEETIATSRTAPLLVVLEDVHWVDPSTREVLDEIVQNIREERALVVVTARPEFTFPWSHHEHAISLTLSRLSRRSRFSIIDAVAGDCPLPDDVRSEVAGKAGGVPLFLEELTRSVLDGMPGPKYEGSPSVGSATSLEIPASLHDSLMARLDRLGTAKRIAQIGAVLGREFSGALIKAVAASEGSNLDLELAQLVESGTLIPRQGRNGPSFLFRHGLIQDAAYESLLRDSRRHLHGIVAHSLLEQFPDRAEDEPELVARHLAAAGRLGEAAGYWHEAGKRAVQQSAMVEAIEHFESGLRGLREGEGSEGERALELALERSRAVALCAVEGYPAVVVGESLRRAIELCRASGMEEDVFSIQRLLCYHHFARGENKRAAAEGADLVAVAERLERPENLLYALQAAAAPLVVQADYHPARRNIDRALSVYESCGHSGLAWEFGYDAGVACLVYSSLERWFSGYPEAAARHQERCIGLAEQVAHPYSSAFGAIGAVVVKYLVGELAREDQQLRLGGALCEEHRFWLQPIFTTCRGWLACRDGSIGGIELLRSGVATWREAGARFFGTFLLLVQADGLSRCGRVDDALDVIQEALVEGSETGEVWVAPELYRLRGVLLEEGGEDAGAVEGSYHEAVRIAREQTSKGLELRACYDLARFSLRQGLAEKARATIAPIYGWFTEGLDRPELKRAGSLIEQIDTSC